MRIYTKTGDKGTTSLYKGERVSKADARVEALGAIDELNSLLGTIKLAPLRKVQKDLMNILSQKNVSCLWLEKEIDRMQAFLPELHKFIIPAGPIHYARTICRRAERRAVAAGFKIKYLNRLSDYLFVLARWTTTN